jgi:uncharacterized membrane protein
MSKDLQATIAGVVSALAVIAQWIATKLGIDLGITADFLGAVTIIGGLFVAWLVGKSGNNKTKEQDKTFSGGQP